MTDWLVTKPFVQTNTDAAALFDIEFPPETNSMPVEWTPVQTQGYRVDLEQLYPTDHAVAYLKTQVWTPTRQEVRFEFGYDDRLLTWINGEELSRDSNGGNFTPTRSVAITTLETGWNELLLKVVNDSGEWSASARLLSLQRDPISGLKYSAMPEE